MSIFVPPRLTEEYRKEKLAHPSLSHETVMRIAKDHLKYEACPPDLAWESRQGVKDYIQQETKRKGPYYALITGVLHGAPADYTKTQPFVEGIVKAGPEHWLDAEKVRAFLNTPMKSGPGRPETYQFSKLRAPVVAEMSKCYLENRENPTVCAEPGRIKGIGLKGSQLIREYLGDENAVAVDRHVFNYVCGKNPEWCKEARKKIQWRSHGMWIPEDVQRDAADIVRAMAFECGKTPADIQTAAWLKGACESARVRKAVKKARVWLGPDKVVHCHLKTLEGPKARKPPMVVRKPRPVPRGVRPLY